MVGDFVAKTDKVNKVVRDGRKDIRFSDSVNEGDNNDKEDLKSLDVYAIYR